VLKLKPDNIQLIVGGGYGLLLRARAISDEGSPPRFGVDRMVRSTTDLDFFLGAEIITDGQKTRRIAEALDELGFVTREPYWIFEKRIAHEGREDVVRIDLLAADVPEEKSHLVHRKKDSRRIRPLGFERLHGRLTREAVTVHNHATVVDVTEDGSGVTVLVPHAVSFILMKLFAFRDRVDDADDDYGAYHAFDVLMTVATMTRVEWITAHEVLQDPAAASVVQEAREIVAKVFSKPHSTGRIRLIDYARVREGLPLTADQVSAFVRDLEELLRVDAEAVGEQGARLRPPQ
jgi:hypothetical protein